MPTVLAGTTVPQQTTTPKSSLKYTFSPKVLGVFHDTGFDFNGAVLYKHEVDMWPPLFLRHYDTGEWCAFGRGW